MEIGEIDKPGDQEITDNSGSDSEMEEEGRSEEKARYFWEEIMERDRRRRDTDRSINDFMCIKSDGYGQMIHFQKRLLEEAGHVLVAVLMDSPGSKEGHLRSSNWEAQLIAEALRCTLANYDDVLSCMGSLNVNNDTLFGILVQTASSQLSLGHSVVIRAPLPRRAQIDSLLDVVDSTKAKLIVLELWKKTQVNKKISSEYNIDDVPKLVLPQLESFGADDEDDHLDFILMAAAMNRWHIGDREESVVEDGCCTNKVKVRHFSHRHPLTLIEQKASTESSPLIWYYCDCCMEPISGSDHPYYLCDHCDFSMHKSCVELPQCWDAPFHIHPLRLMIQEYESDRESRIVAFLGRNRTEPQISCIVCKGTKKGPVYRCWSCYAFFIHHQCAMPLTEDVRHQCHAHPLHGRTAPKVSKFSCYGCGGRGQSVCYSCLECPSDFHLECALRLTLTPSVKHKCHWHPLVLTSTPPKDDTDEYYCEVCAEPRHGDHWIYYCKPCEYEAHPHCVNPDIPPYTMPEAGDSSKQSRESSEDESSDQEEEEQAIEEGSLSWAESFIEEEEQASEEGSLAGAESSILASDGESS